jgi:hypothetical protein
MNTVTFKTFAGKVRQLRLKLQPNGCVVHLYPPPAREEVVTFERRFEITVPADSRRFFPGFAECYLEYLNSLLSDGRLLHHLPEK